LVEAGPRGLSEGALLDAVWEDDLPATGHKALQVLVSRVRSLTAPEVVERTATGYRLGLGVDDVDLWAARPRGLALAAEGRYAEALPLLELADEDDEVLAARLRSVAGVHGLPAALEQYEAYRAELAERLGVDPAPVLRDLHAELLRRDRPVRAGLRFDADALIGREDDLAAIRALLRSPSARVVSIVGPGGLGKTRLAHLLGREADQPVVHFVPLASVTSDSGVAVEIADVLGVQGSVTATLGSAGRPADVLERLVEAIGTVPSLLILDNCEQVVSGVADVVAELIRRTPALTVLTTTRAPLGLSAERVYLLPQLSSDDGVALFRERAEAARPGVALDDDAIAALVERLDGLPLAVELAAAKVRVMSVEEIARRLDSRFTLLRGGSRDAPERHQTLLAVIDWSWNLLSEDQRSALRRLSVFRAGFALEGAEAVIGGDALDRITELIDQSLVVVDESPHGVRYRLLETVREFSRMQLIDAGDDAAAEAQVECWAASLAHEFFARVYSGEQIAQITRLRAEEGNLVEVLRRALDGDEVLPVLEIFAALSTFWTIEGSHLKVVGFAAQVGGFLTAGEVPDELADLARMALVAVIANSMIFTGGVEPATLDLLTRLGPGQGPREVAAQVKVMLTLATQARADQIPALETLMDDADPAVARLAAYWASHAWENAGDLGRSSAAAERSLALCDPADGPWGMASANAQLAGLALQAGDWTEARERSALALPTLRAVGASEDAAQLRAIDALVALREGLLDEADRILDEIAAEDAVSSVFGYGIALICGRAEVLLARGKTVDGLAAYVAGTAELAWRSQRDRTRSGMPELDGVEPWLMLPEAASLAAHVRAGEAEVTRSLRDELVGKARTVVVADSPWLDFPILGCLFAALGAWEAALGSAEQGAELVALAESFSVNRMLPSLDPDWGDPLADPVTVASYRAGHAGRRPSELREAAAAVLAKLA
jgi:predicted ATPase